MSVYHIFHSRGKLENEVFPNCSYQEFHRQILKHIAWLQEQGLEKGDVFCIQMEKSEELLLWILASMALGCPVLPLNEQYTQEEVLFYLEDTEASLAILLENPKHWNGKTILVSELPDISRFVEAEFPVAVDLEEQALFLYTSGTTGKPKGAMISHQNILACVRGLDQAWQWSEKDILLHILPLFHVHGLVVAMFGALYAGAKTILMPKFDAQKAVELLEKEKISICMAVPTIHYRFSRLERVPSLPNLRLLTSGSAPLPVSLHQLMQKKFGVTIVERYGMTEVGIVLSNPYSGECRAGTVGFPVGNMQFRIVDSEGKELPDGEIGELLIKGDSVIKSYWKRSEQTEKTIVDGWLYSGDLAKKDADGYYSIVGRAKDLIISGGFNIYPKEVEACLLKLDCVQEVAVIGLPNEEWGETVVGVVIGSGEEREIIDYAKEHLASYKCPRRILFAEDFPRNAMGKIQKAILRKRYGEVK